MSCDRPKKSLGLTPVISSIKELGLALMWVVYLRTCNAERKATLDNGVQLLKAEYAKASELKIGKEKIDSQVYLKTLEQEVSRFTNANKEMLFVGSKTYVTPIASISARVQQPRLVITDEDKAVDRLIDQFDLQPEIDRLKDEFPEAFRFLRISFDIDKQGLLAAYQAKQLTDEQMTPHGIKVDVPKDEAITIKA